MEESNNEQMTYLAIPDEACYIVNANDDIQFDIYSVPDDATCIIFQDDSAQHFKEISEYMQSIKECKMKTAWFTEKETIPFRAEKFDYIKTKDALFVNITDSRNPKYYDITKHIITDISQLDPLSTFYFDMHEELIKNKNKN